MIRLVVILLLLIPGNPGDIAKVNKLKKEAESAYKSGEFDVAISHYSYLQDSLNIEDERITLNLGHAYFQNKQVEFAESQYKKLIDTADENIKSIAYQQLGVLSNDPNTLENALTYFKAALKANPANEDARYNYELIKKKLRDQQNQNQDQENQDQENQDQNEENKEDQQNEEQEQNQDQKDQEQQDQESQEQQDQESQEQENKNQQDQNSEGQESDEEQEQQQQEDKQPEEEQNEQQQQGEEGEEGEEQEEQPQPGEESEEEQEPSAEERKQQQQQMTQEKLEEMNISEEKAKMILEALKNGEIQYIQQNRRKPTQSKDSDKPDW